MTTTLSRYTTAAALALSCAVPTPGFTAPVAVVPGSAAAYLYLPTSNVANRANVTFFKEGGFTDYTIVSEPPGVKCEPDEEQCSFKLDVDRTYTFMVHGGYTDELKVLPTWREGCAATLTPKCTTVVSAGVSVKVHVEALSAADLTPVRVGETGIARFLGQLDDGSYLVGATDHIIRTRYWQTPEVITGATHRQDGRENMGKITNSAYVDHCLTGLPAELGGDWYWPAIQELEIVNSSSWMRLVNIKELWSSTERSRDYAFQRKMEKGETKSEEKSKSDRGGLCVRRF